MKRQDYHALVADVRRFRLVAAIVVAIVVLLPTLDEMVSQGLSPLIVLVRLVEALIVAGILVWCVSGVVLHYARVQIRSQAVREPED
jgi:hypothetical protein